MGCWPRAAIQCGLFTDRHALSMAAAVDQRGTNTKERKNCFAAERPLPLHRIDQPRSLREDANRMIKA